MDAPDIDSDLIHTIAAREVVAASLFLNDDRFPELRSEQDLDEGYPKSYQNCIPSSMFLTAILSAACPQDGWGLKAGKADYEWHAFVVSEDGLLADVTGDQFGFSPAILKPLRDCPAYRVDHSIANFTDAGDVRTVTRWLREWSECSEVYREQAVDILRSQLACFTMKARTPPMSRLSQIL